MSHLAIATCPFLGVLSTLKPINRVGVQVDRERWNVGGVKSYGRAGAFAHEVTVSGVRAARVYGRGSYTIKYKVIKKFIKE